ncbi:MAG TPA: DUF6775 family putative metallopeptidase [Nitrososphaeraceae archaeon]|nr:DUF6775 family putative metallopeptidase [Nitrososphaeraceae archaeon]
MLYCKQINFLNESSWPEIDIEKIIACLKKVLPNNVIEKELKESLLYLNSIDKEKSLSFYNHAIVQDLKKPLYIYDLNYNHYYSHSYNHNEKKVVVAPNKKKEFVDLLLYDGFVIQKLLQKLLQKLIQNDEQQQQQQEQEQELTFTKLYILITDKLLCTFDETDWRYHARSLICGNPTLISTSGIVEGIAKPRDYYYKLYFFRGDDLDIVDELKREYNGQFVNYNDPRINDIIIGLSLQSLFYFINSGDPFCEDRNCRLFNAHFQDDIIRINIKEKKICQRHKILLNKYNQSLFIDNNRSKKKDAE